MIHSRSYNDRPSHCTITVTHSLPLLAAYPLTHTPYPPYYVYISKRGNTPSPPGGTDAHRTLPHHR
ncbi:hypothetical protein SEA_WATERT_127 [Microbacterium phage WaterT]|nr:hypothetical protein SEA_WATERT_5 [Microbacterium phage WaterT]QDK01394.1 hypothetical protein SEA_WATERT_127 [Microbacterium phage WaterT]